MNIAGHFGSPCLFPIDSYALGSLLYVYDFDTRMISCMHKVHSYMCTAVDRSVVAAAADVRAL